MRLLNAKKIGTKQAELFLSCLKNNKKISESSLFQKVEQSMPFEVKEETFQAVAKQVLERARRVSEELKKNPVDAVKNIKGILFKPDSEITVLEISATSKKKPIKKKKVKAKGGQKKTKEAKQ